MTAVAVAVAVAVAEAASVHTEAAQGVGLERIYEVMLGAVPDSYEELRAMRDYMATVTPLRSRIDQGRVVYECPSSWSGRVRVDEAVYRHMAQVSSTDYWRQSPLRIAELEDWASATYTWQLPESVRQPLDASGPVVPDHLRGHWWSLARLGRSIAEVETAERRRAYMCRQGAPLSRILFGGNNKSVLSSGVNNNTALEERREPMGIFATAK